MNTQPCVLVYLKILVKFLALQASLAQTLDLFRKKIKTFINILKAISSFFGPIFPYLHTYGHSFQTICTALINSQVQHIRLTVQSSGCLKELVQP